MSIHINKSPTINKRIVAGMYINNRDGINSHSGPRLLVLRMRDRNKPCHSHRRCSHSFEEIHPSILKKRYAGTRGNHPITIARIYVPSDSFGGVSPERKGAEVINTFFTFVAVKIVLAQLEGSSSGRGTTAGAYNPEGYKVLDTFLREHPLKNSPDIWLGKLMKTDKMIGTHN